MDCGWCPLHLSGECGDCGLRERSGCDLHRCCRVEKGLRFCSLCKITAIIPYPKNQFKHVKGLLRVDKLFRAPGPRRQVKLYHKRSADERSNAWLKGFYGLNQLQARGLENATIHVTLCVMVSFVIAIAALKHRRPDLIRSPTLPHQIYTQKLKLQ